MHGIDVSAFSRPITKADIRSFSQQFAPDTLPYAWLATNRLTDVTLLIAIVLSLVAVLVGIDVIKMTSIIGNVAFLFTLFVVIYIIGSHLIQHKLARSVRLHWFAADNGFSYIPHDTSPRNDGIIFQVGDDRRYQDVIASDELEFGNYSYEIGSGRNRRISQWGYVRVQLASPMPQILLDARSNNVKAFGVSWASNLDFDLASGQKVKLEGDFSDVFDLYVPKGFERDIYYLLTPDLMVKLIDHGADCDIEVYNDALYIYSSVQFDGTQQSYERMFNIIDTIADGIYTRAERYVTHVEPHAPVRSNGLELSQWKDVGAVVVIGVMILLAASAWR